MIIQKIPVEPNGSNKKIRIAGYCRVSTKKTEQEHSFAAQIKYFRDYVKDIPNVELVDIYADEGITGTSMEKRDEFMRMMKDAKLGKIDRIVTKSVSRFARNNEECLFAVRMLKEYDVSVYFEKERIDTGMMSSEFLISLFGMTAQMESKTISDNMRWSYKHRMKSGEFVTCKAPLGYKLEKRNLEIIEEEAELVRRIFDMYLSGMGFDKITTILNNEGVGKRYGYDVWHPWTIKYILTNERYMGDAILQKRYTTDTLPFREKVNHGEKEMFYVENSNPPIISREIFEAAQALMSFRRSLAEAGTKNTSAFQGVMYCSECGKKMRRVEISKKKAWVCCGYSRQKTSCSAHKVFEEDVVDAFKILTIKMYEHREEIFGTAIEQLKKVVDIVGTHRERIKEIDINLARMSKQCYAISQLYMNQKLTDVEYISKTNPIHAEMNRLRSERRQLIKMDKEEDSLSELIDLKAELDTCDSPYVFNETLFDEIVNKITVDEKGEITFHLLGGLKIQERGQF